MIDIDNIGFLGGGSIFSTVRFETRKAGWEAQMLPLCHAVSPDNIDSNDSSETLEFEESCADRSFHISASKNLVDFRGRKMSKKPTGIRTHDLRDTMPDDTTTVMICKSRD